MRDNILVLYRKSEELLYRVYPLLINFPKSEKFSLCQNIKEALYKLITLVSLGNSVKTKRKFYLQEADGYLQTLKVLVKLSKELKYISLGLFKSLDLNLTEINILLTYCIKNTR